MGIPKNDSHQRCRMQAAEMMRTVNEILTFALENPALLYGPACGFVLALVVLRIKKRYLNEGGLVQPLACFAARPSHFNYSGKG